MQNRRSNGDASERGAPFPVVGVGASAGGLDALTELLRDLPNQTGMAFLVVQHLDRETVSILSEVLAKATAMPVYPAEDGVRIAANTVYVIPPRFDLALMHGKLALIPRTAAERKPHHSIDLLFRSLAAELGPNAIGVVLSGTGTDGTLGLKAIKAEGGITCAQTPATAKFDGMPATAISTGVVDIVRRPGGIAKELARIAAHPYLARHASVLEPLAERERQDLTHILALVRDHTGVDFTEYKEPTIRRRLARRLALHRCARIYSP